MKWKPGIRLKEMYEAVRAHAVMQALHHTYGHIGKAACLLEVSQDTVSNVVKAHRIDVEAMKDLRPQFRRTATTGRRRYAYVPKNKSPA